MAVRYIDPFGILLFQGVILGLLMAGGLWLFLLRCSERSCRERMKSSLLTFFMIYSFVFTVSATVDRSYSVQMLNQLATSPSGLSNMEVDAVHKKYFFDHGGVAKRIQEQTTTSSIQHIDGCIYLTKIGKNLVQLFHVTEIVCNCGVCNCGVRS